MRYIYRVQNKEGRGPYQGLGAGNWSTRSHDTMRHPSPLYDLKLRQRWTNMQFDQQREYFFGFSTMRQLKAWFSKKELATLQALGFEVVKLPRNQYWIMNGTKQLIFKERDTSY